MELPPQIAAALLPPPFGMKREKSLPDRLALVPEGLSDDEARVLRQLSSDIPVHIDALLEQSNLTVSDLTAALLTLEMKELVRALPGKCFVRKM